MFSLNEEITFERAYNKTATARYHQLAPINAFRELVKLILVLIYQKHRTVMVILKRSFRTFEPRRLPIGGAGLSINDA
jgi:hypothetical protein